MTKESDEIELAPGIYLTKRRSDRLVPAQPQETQVSPGIYLTPAQIQSQDIQLQLAETQMLSTLTPSQKLSYFTEQYIELQRSCKMMHESNIEISSYLENSATDADLSDSITENEQSIVRVGDKMRGVETQIVGLEKECGTYGVMDRIKAGEFSGQIVDVHDNSEEIVLADGEVYL